MAGNKWGNYKLPDVAYAMRVQVRDFPGVYGLDDAVKNIAFQTSLNNGNYDSDPLTSLARAIRVKLMDARRECDRGTVLKRLASAIASFNQPEPEQKVRSPKPRW